MKKIIIIMMILISFTSISADITKTDGVVLITAFDNIQDANEWSAKNYDKVIVRAIRPYVCGMFIRFTIEFVPRDGVTINMEY